MNLLSHWDSPPTICTKWHSDLCLSKMFAAPENPTKIVSLKSIDLAPIFLRASHSTFIDFEGPEPEGSQLRSVPQ